MKRTALSRARPTHRGQWVIDMAVMAGSGTLTPNGAGRGLLK